MKFTPPSPDIADIDPALLDRPDPPPGTFEIALVLGGTVSAGAWTAGAIDFLFEALDALELNRAAEKLTHRVIVRVISGTSGGGVNAAIAARALGYAFPHVTRSTPPEQAALSPFYDVWVNKLTFEGFLDAADIGKTVPSLLNGAPLDAAAEGIAGYTVEGALAPGQRDWVGVPLKVILTTTNLGGVPTRITFNDGQTQGFVDHADYQRFNVLYQPPMVTTPRPDELTLSIGGTRQPQAVGWDDFSLFARATAAFPVGFPTRQMVAPLMQYGYRIIVPPADDTGKLKPVYLTPDWGKMTQGPSDTYHFSAVDGGATNNEPIGLARTTLAGLCGRNPRDAATANRAVLLIEPFAGAISLSASGVNDVVATAMATLNTLLQQTRYDTRDLALATDEKVFSRFMLTPWRSGMSGAEALASGGLGAFLGFACSDFTRHDYLLGRKNCQDFLRSQFNLSKDNPVFADWAGRAAHANDLGLVPIIPLFGEVAVPESLDPWPVGALDPEQFRDALKKRVKAVFEAEFSGVLGGVGAWLSAEIGEGWVAGKVIGAITNALSQAKPPLRP